MSHYDVIVLGGDVAAGAAAQDDDVEVCHRGHPSTVTSMFSTKITRSCR